MSIRSRVLVLGINYAPEHTGIGPYTTGMARGLSREHDVQVVTTHPHYPAWRIAEGYGAWRHDEIDAGVHVRRLRHYVPSSPTGLSRVLSEATFAGRALAARPSRPNVIIAVSPALLSVYSARALAARWRVPMGVVVQDLYSRAMVEVGLLGGRGAGRVARLEAAALRSATGVVAIHERLAASMTRDLGVPGERMTVIPNWTHVQPPRVPRDAVRRRLGWDEQMVLLHAGNMGAKQGLEHVVDAAALAQRRGDRLRIVLMGNGSQRSELEARAAGITTLDIMDGVPSHDFSDVLAAADVLLLHERPGIEEMCVPSKLTSYFAAGRPVLAATSRTSAAAYEIEASGAGRVVESGDPARLLQGLKEIAHNESPDKLGSRGRTYAQERLNEESALKSYREWITMLLGSSVVALNRD